MATPDPKQIVQYLIDLRLRIDGLRTHFYYIESEFSLAFQSLDRKPSHNGFAELGLFIQLLSRYVQRRTEPDFLDGLIAQDAELGKLDLGTSRLQPLNSWLSEMAQHEDEAQIFDCFETWQGTSKAFLRYIESESRFVNESLRKLNTPHSERKKVVSHQQNIDRT